MYHTAKHMPMGCNVHDTVGWGGRAGWANVGLGLLCGKGGAGWACYGRLWLGVLGELAG